MSDPASNTTLAETVEMAPGWLKEQGRKAKERLERLMQHQDRVQSEAGKSRILRETLQCAYKLHEAKHLSDAGLAEFLEIADGE